MSNFMGVGIFWIGLNRAVNVKKKLNHISGCWK